MAEVEKMGGFNIDSKEIVDLISGALSPKGSGSSKITKTIEIKTEFKGKPLEELKETYELIEKIQKKVGKRDARLDFFTKPDTALKHVVQAYKEMADLKEKGVPNKSETGEFVRWANAFQALGGSIEDIQKVLPKSVNVQDIITSFMKQSGGASGKGYDRYSVDAYKELFDLAKELEKLGYADMSTLSKRYAELPEEVGRVVEKTKQKIEEVKPSEPVITVDDIISQDKIKSRIDEIKKELKTIFEMDEGDFGLLFSGSSKKQINDILGDYYELVRYSEKIKSPDIVTSTETSAFERVLNRARVDGVKINATTETTARGRANKAYKEAEEMAIAARSMTKSAEEIDAAKKKSSEPQPASGGTSGNVEQAGEAARQARETAKQAGEAAQDMGENGQQAGQKMAKGVEGAVSKLQELKSQLDEAKQKLEELEEQQSRIDKQFRDGKLFEEKLAIWRKYGKTSENPEQWLVQQVDEHIKEGKIEKAAIYRNILKANYKENNTPFFDEDGKEIKLAPIAKGFIQAYKANVTTDNLNDINKQVLAQRELVEGLQAQVDAEEKLDNVQKRNDESARKFSETYKEKMSLDGTPEKVSAKYEELFQKITSGAIKSSEAIKELKTFIEQLGLAFDESNQKWVAISSEAKDITKEIGQTFGITDEKVLDQISIQIQGMVDTLKGGGKLDTNGLFDIFKAKFKTREENEDYKEVRSWLKPKSVYVPEGAKTEFGDNYMQYIRAIGTRNITHKLGEGAQLFEFARQSEVFSRIFGDAINEFEMFEKLAQFLIKEKASVVKSPFDTEKTEESIKLLDILQSKLKEMGLLREEVTRTDENGFLIPEEQLSQGIEELLKKSKLTREEIVQLEEELQRLKSVTSIPMLDFDGDTLDENIRRIEEKLSIEKEAFQGSAQENPMEESEEQTGAIIDRNNQSLKERLEYLKMLRNESRFMETADDKRTDMEEKAWDAGGENPKTDEEAQRKITAYEDHITRMENADKLFNEFERNYEQVVITLKSGEQIIVHSVDDLEGLSLAMAKISDIKFVPFPNEEDHLDSIRQEYESLISEIESANKDSLNLVDYKSIEEAQSGIEKLEDALTKLKAFRKDNAEDLDLMDETSYDLDAFIEKLQNVKKHYEGQLEQLDRKKRYGFMTEANGLEGYKSADQSFVTALAAQVAEGTKQYDEAMEELKEHIKQKQEEVRQEQERNQRVNGELSKFVSGTNPIIEAMGLAQDEPRPQAYGDFISQIQSESIKGEEAVTEFAKAVGYAYDEVSKTWQKIQSTQGSQPDVQQEITSIEQLISVINELEKIYGQFQRPKYKIQDPSYLGELYDRVDILDMSGYNDTSATEENIENLRTKMMEIYNLYKKITSAINNNNGWYKGVQYTRDDQSALIGNFKAYAQAYHELVTEYNKRETWAQKEIGIDPQYLKTLDVVVQGLTKDFKGYAQEVITDSQSVKENNQLYVEEQEQLKQSNALLRERYELLRDMVIAYAKKQGADYDKRSLIQDLIPPLFNDEDYYYEWGESFERKSNNVLQDILKLLGIDIPEAAQRAESAIDGVTQQGENSSQASLDISQVTNIDQLSEYVKQLDIAKASAEELQSILSKAKEFGGLSSLPSEQVAQLTARMEELGMASEQAAKGEMQAADAAQAGAAADGVAAGAAQQAADADERAADANEKKANADAQGASAASASAEGDATGAQGASGEAQGFTALGKEVDTVKQLVQEKNNLIKQEVDYVNQNLPGEIQQFKDLADSLNTVKEKLDGIIEIIPNVKFDFTGQDSTTKMTTFLNDISSLNQALKDLDGKDVFHHLSDILNASDVNLTNNLNSIIQKFKELKEVMNGFDDNGTAVFKSLSDLANAGDQLVEKMQKLFKESGVKLPTVAQKQTQDKTKATELMATKSEEISSFVLSDIKRAPEELEHVSTKMEAMGNGIVKVTQVVSQALEDGSFAFREYTYRIKETEDGFSIEDKKIQKDGLALEKQALAYKKFVDQMDKVSQKVEPIYDGKGKMMTITPETEGWEQLVELAHHFGVEMENAVKVTRIVQNGRESFQFDMSNGNAVRLGMNSNNILIEKNPIIDKKAEETAAKQRGKDVEELANSYLKLAEAEHKAEESRQKTGIEDQRYTKEVNDLKQRQIELTERLGTLSEEEQKRISSGQNYANLQRERYGMTTQDVDKEFGTAAQAYDTLIKKMKQYYSIIEKQSLGKPLTIGDQAFLQKYGTYFEQAGRAAKGASEDIGIFVDKSQEAVEAQNRFKQETEIMNANMVDRYESNLLSQITSLEPVGEDKTDIYNTKVIQVQEQFKKLQEIGAQIKLGNTEQADEYLNLTKEIQGEINKINSGSYNFADPTKVAKLDRQMADWNAKNTGAPSEYVEQIKSFRSTLSQGLTGEEFDAVVQGFERTKAAAAEAGSVGASFVDGLKQRMRSLGQYLLSFASFYRIIGVFRKAFTIVKDLDTAMTEMRKVSEESVETLSRYQFESFDMADKVGTTAKQIQDSTADWLRLGRTFEQSKTLAEQSTVLLNVSEFENINDATQALVSATQAYDELDAQTIIDKLNLIGNNFAVSTSDLAQGLQNAAAVLKTQGNDIDQSLALLTAGNLIGQDISKASMGIRTISLRISGTEEAKDEVKDMGEDIDDFVVRTKSKTDQIIRDYTAVASNAYKGVSVLDANGNLRDTYDILLDISKIYKEIQDEDKKNGTNRAQALVETLAGKTRSNIAASILLNGDVLEDVYNASANDYEGSAQRENEKYLDSIEGRVARLQNRLQELAFTSFAADDIKPIISFLTDAVGLATTLVDKIGLLPALIGTVGGAVLQFSGKGLITGGGFGGIWDSIQQSRLGRMFGQRVLSDENKAFFGSKDFAKGLNGSEYGKNGFIDLDLALKNGYGELTEDAQEYFLTLKNGGATLVQVSEAQMALSKNIITGSSIMRGFIGIGKTMISTLATMGATMAAAFIMQGVIKLISDAVHHSENLIKAGEEAKSTMDSAKQSFDETKKSIGELSDEYAKLSTGVEVKGNTVKNLNLSEEEFARYIELSNQIKEIAPELVTGYTDQGNAIVDLGNNIDDVNSKFENYLSIQQQIANGEFGKNLDTMWKGTLEQASKYEKEAYKFEDDLANIRPTSILGLDGSIQTEITKDTLMVSVDPDAERAFSDALIDAGLTMTIPKLNPETGLLDYILGGDVEALTEQEIKSLNTVLSKISFSGDKEAANSQANKAKQELLIKKLYADQLPYIQEYIRSNSVFDLMEDDTYAESLREGIVRMMDNVDFESIRPQIKEKGGLQAWLDDFIANFAVAEPETKEAVQELLKLQNNRDKTTVEEYQKKRAEYLSKIASSEIMKEAGYEYIDLGVLFGESEYKEDSWGVNWDEQTRTQNAAEKLGIDYGNLFSKISTYSYEAFSSALSAVEQMSQADAEKIAGDYNKIWAFLEPYLTGEAVIKQEDPTDTLSQVFNADGFDVSKYTSKLSAVETALSSLYENGFLSDQEKVTLQDALPDLSDFDIDSIKRAGGDALKQYIKYIRDEASKYDLTEDAQRDLDTYVANIAKSYATSISSNSDMFKVLHDSVKAYVDENAPEDWTPRLIESETDQQYKDIISALGDRLSSEDAATIMLMLDADGTLANGSIEEIVEKWDEYEIQLGINLNDEEEARIKRDLQHIETAQGLNDARISSAEANGGRASRGQRQQAYDLARAATREAEKYTQTQLDDYQRALGSGDEEYIRSIWDSVLQSRTDEEQKRQAETEALKALLESDANGLFEEEERLETEAGILQTQREHEEKFDGAASESTLKAIQKNDEDRQKNAKALADFFTELAESDEYPQFSEDFIKSAADYLSKALGFESDVFDDAMQHHQNAINALGDDLSRVQAQAQATSDALSLAEAQGRETTAADYQRQIDDAEDQIAVLIKQRREQLAIQRDLQGQEGTQAYKDAQAEVENLTSQIRQLQVEQVNAQKAMGEIPMLHLQADQTSLEEESQKLQDELSDPRNAPTVDVYVNLIANADDQISNLEQQRAELQRKMAEAESRQGFSVYDTDYVEYRSRLAEVDSQIQQVTQSQLEWRKAILEMPLDKINQQLEEYADKLSRISAARELSEASGRATTERDYLVEAQTHEGEANLHHRASILRGLEAASMIANGYSIDSEEVRSVISQRNQEYTSWMSSRTSALQSRRTADELNLGRIQDQIGLLEQSASQLNDAISLAEASGQTITAMDYQRLVGNADVQIAKNEELISEYESLMAKWTPEQGSEIWKTYVEGIDNATSQITQLRQSQVEWHDTMMQLGLTDLQNEQADLERQITVAEQEHHKVSEKTYRDLLKNGERQIKNLRAQQRGLDKMEPKYREIQSQIDQVSDSMREWENTADHLALTAGQNLSSAISSAMSEINSETGLTRDTMDSLLQSFDELTAYDLSGLFYESADGMKLNVGMAQDLIDAQYELTMSGYEKTIAEQNKIIAENTGLQDENAQAALAAAQRRKLSAEQDMAMYQAQYNVQNQALSSFQAWQNATQTKNAGANYETYQGAWKGIQEAYTKGLTGTDDFRTYVAFFDRWGQDTVEAYERNKQKISRYITEGSTGVDNFIKDLVAKGYGEKNAEGGYDVSLSDVEDISRDLQISEDAVRMMINRGEDYGWIVTMVDTVQEGGLKISDTTHDLIQETLRYQEMLANGATADELKNQKDYIDELTTSIGDYTDSINELDEEHGKITSTRLQTELDKISALQQFLDNEELTAEMPKGVKAKFEEDINEAIQQISGETGIPIVVDAEGNFRVDQEKLQEQFDGFRPKITIDEITDESFTNARKELTEIPSLTEAAEGVLGVGENDLMGSTFTKLQDGWEENKESLGDYIDQLNGLNLSQEAIDNIETLDFADGGYTKGLEEFESILDNVAKMFGITADEAQYLLPILEAMGLVNITGTQTWSKPISSIMGTDVYALDQWIRDTEGVDVDLNFDPTEMSVDELTQKLNELSELEINPNIPDEAKAQLEELMSSLYKQLNIQSKLDSMKSVTGYSVDEFLGLDEQGQKDVMLKLGVNPEDYDSFIENAQNQSIAVKIEAALKDGKTVEELLAIEDNTEFANALGIDEDSVDAAREMLENISMEPYKTAGQTIADQIEDKSSSIGSKIGTGFIEAVTGFIDLLTGGEGDENPFPITSSGDTSTPGVTSFGASTASATTSATASSNQNVSKPKAISVPEVQEVVTQMSVVGAKESKAEVSEYTETIKQIPEEKETTITTTNKTINDTENNVISNYKMAPSELTNNINKETKSSGGTINVSVNVQGQEQVDSLKQSIDSIEGKNVDVRASVYGIGTVSTLNNQISKVTGKDVSINASVNGFALVSGLVSKINDLKDKTVTITTEHKTVMTRAGQYTGSVTGTPYTAHASGTAYNMLNLTPKTEANAAGNDVSIQKTGKSLVNELGQESLIIPKFICLKRDLVTLYSNVH